MTMSSPGEEHKPGQARAGGPSGTAGAEAARAVRPDNSAHGHRYGERHTHHPPSWIHHAIVYTRVSYAHAFCLLIKQRTWPWPWAGRRGRGLYDKRTAHLECAPMLTPRVVRPLL